MTAITEEAAAARTAAPYWNPYVAGVGLGFVLLMSFVVLGTGLGASGAITRVAATAAHSVAPATIEGLDDASDWFASGSPLADYLVFMTLGTFVGGFASALLARRARPMLERGTGASPSRRVLTAVLGGALVGAASRLAGGCTSGQALSGGALFSAGSWAFMFAVFAGAFAAAPLVRKEWLR